MAFQRITMNLVGARKRYEMLEGKQYLVVPTVMITPGVWEGSEGPGLYLKQELSKNPSVWNHKPVVLHHPQMETGEGISACDPSVIEAQGLGKLFNSGYDGRLKTECWIDEPKLKRLDHETWNRISNNQMVEVSTGLFHDPELAAGELNGKKYDFIVRNIQPDHLAILPDRKGACSIADGAGLLRNAADHGLSNRDIEDHLHAELKAKHGESDRYFGSHRITDVYPKHVVYEKNDKHYKHGYKVKSGKASFDGEPEEVRKQTSYVCANGAVLSNDQQGPLRTVPKPTAKELSEPMQKQQMQKALLEKYSGVQQEGDWGGWVTDLYANYVVWSKDGKLFRLPYTYDDDRIIFDEEDPEEVERVSEYRTRRQTPIDGTSSPYNTNQESSVANNNQKPAVNAMYKSASEMAAGEAGKGDGEERSAAGGARKDQVDKLISGGGWTEQERKWLSDLPDGPFEKILKYSKEGATQPVVPYSYAGIGDRSSVHQNQAGNGTGIQNKAKEYVDQIESPEIREVLNNALMAQAAEKKRLVKVIVNHPRNKFNEAWLLEQDKGLLQGIALMAFGKSSANRGADYSGQSPVPPMLVDNAGFEDEPVGEEEVLLTPTINWDDEKPNKRNAG